jgi:hypothetical protein
MRQEGAARLFTPSEIVSKIRTSGILYASPLNFTHSSNSRTMQEMFHAGPLVGDAVNAIDLSDLFDAGAVSKKL